MNPLVRLTSFLLTERNKLTDGIQLSREKEKCDALLKDALKKNIILDGPFKSMKYTKATDGSSYYPKVLGTYEKELHPIIEAICEKEYQQIFNIGCAEGYYAVGLALRMPTAKIVAFDLDAESRQCCYQTACMNNVESRIDIKEACTQEFLCTFKSSKKTLIVCDCEGFEKDLFSEATAKNLKACDLLIETHDFIDINISTYIKSVFSPTHHIISIKSIDDIEKATTYNVPELKSLSLQERRQILREGRPSIMEWLWMSPKTLSVQ